jgi:hypothetical protein
MFSKLNSDNNVRKNIIEMMLEENYIDYSNNSNTTSKMKGKLTNYCDNNYIGDKANNSNFKNKMVNDDNDNVFNDFPQYDSVLFILTKTRQFISQKEIRLKNEIYFNLGKLHELLPDLYKSKINLNKIFLDNDNWKEAHILIEDIIKEITNYT